MLPLWEQMLAQLPTFAGLTFLSLVLWKLLQTEKADKAEMRGNLEERLEACEQAREVLQAKNLDLEVRVARLEAHHTGGA